MVENLKIALFIMVVVSASTGLILFLAMRFIRRQNERLKLIMKTLYLNTKSIKNISDKTDLIVQEQQISYENQRKSFDHHRVLVSSLNRQLKYIEVALLNGNNIDPSGGSQINPPDTQPDQLHAENDSMSPVQIAQNAQQKAQLQVKNDVRKQGVTLLKTLFEEKRIRNSKAAGNAQKAATLSAIFTDQESPLQLNVTEETRRVSNG